MVSSAAKVGAAESTIPPPAGESVSGSGGMRAPGVCVRVGGGNKLSGRRTWPAALTGRVIVVGGDGDSSPPSCRGEREQERGGQARARGDMEEGGRRASPARYGRGLVGGEGGGGGSDYFPLLSGRA